MENTNEVMIHKIQRDGVSKTAQYLLEESPDISNFNSITKDLTRLSAKETNLKKSKHMVKGKENYDRFLKTTYKLPASTPTPSSATSPLGESTQCLTSFDAHTYQRVAASLSEELLETKETINHQTDQLKALQTDNDEQLQKKVEKQEVKRCELKRTLEREGYYREKCIKLERNTGKDCEDLERTIEKLRQELEETNEKNKRMKMDLKQVHSQISYLENQQTEHVEAVKENVQLYNEDTRQYSLKLHQCVYDLLDHHVGIEHISPVINSVMTVINKTQNKLPSPSTIENWSIERSIIARKHISETCDERNTTLHSDEASKYGSKWGAFATRNEDGDYLVLGLRDMATKSSEDTLNTFKDILNDIDLAAHVTDNSVSNKLLTNIKNTMSDRAATETKFNSLLKSYREELLPSVIEQFNEIDTESQNAISSMNNFFCGLHSLVHMAESSEKSVFEAESAHFDGNIPIENPAFRKSNQPGTIRLIYTACKAFARRGDQKNGCHGGFSFFAKDFLIANGINTLPLAPYKGNRFNIVFANAGHVYFLHQTMKAFLDKCGSMNGLLTSVLQDLKQPFFIAGCKALGLVSKLITTPLWNVIEDKTISMAQMSGRYLQLLTFLKDIPNRIDEFILGNISVYDDIPVKKDKLFDSLTEPSPLDDHVTVILGVVVPALAKLIQHQFGDHLPGGIHENVSAGETKSADKHNKVPERVFAYVDHLLAAKPNIKTLALEAQITFSLNKTGAWLDDREDTAEVIKSSRKEVKKERERFREREREIVNQRLEKQKQEFRRKEEQEKRRIERLEKETTDLCYYGLWQSVGHVDKELEKIKSKVEKEDALKVQLRFRKNVFKQKSDSKVYNVTKVINDKRVNLTINELRSNVITLIEQSFQIPSAEEPTQNIFIRKTIRHRFIESNKKEKWYIEQVISQVLFSNGLRYNSLVRNAPFHNHISKYGYIMFLVPL